MRCYNCGRDVAPGADRCPSCSAKLGAGATVVLDQAYAPNQYTVPMTGNGTTVLKYGSVNTASVNTVTSYPASRKPAIQFNSNRKLWKMIVFGLLTFGIYDIVVWCKMVTELNVVACRYDGKRTMPYFAMIMLMSCTFGIMFFVWGHNFSERVGKELDRRGYDYQFGAKTFWIWNVMGALILVGPFIYLSKLIKSMNCINEDFNENG